MRPALKPGLLPVWRSRDTVQFGIDPRRAIALTGMREGGGLLALLDGSRDRSQVLAAARELGIGPETADRVITLLAAAGVLHDFPLRALTGLPGAERGRLARELATASLAHRDGDGGARVLARRRAAHIRVHGGGQTGAAIASLLCAAGAGQVTSTGPRPLPGDAGLEADLAPAPATERPGPAEPPGHTGPVRQTGPARHTEPPEHTGPAGHTEPPGHIGPAGHTEPSRHTGPSGHPGPGGHPEPAVPTGPSGPGKQAGHRGRARARHPDLVVIADCHRRDLPRALVRARSAHLAVSASEAIGVVGPLVVPGSSACLRCLDLTRADGDPAWPLILAQLASQAPDPPACDVMLAAAVAAQAAAQALAFIDRGAPAVAVINGTLELVLPDWQWKRRTWQPHPRCDCGTRRLP